MKIHSYETQQRVKIQMWPVLHLLTRIQVCVFVFLFLDVFVISAFQVGYWLNLFNAELSPKTHWRGPRSQKVEGNRETMSLYVTLHCHHQNDSCIKIGSDESHFNVSLIVRAKVTRQCPPDHIF